MSLGSAFFTARGRRWGCAPYSVLFTPPIAFANASPGLRPAVPSQGGHTKKRWVLFLMERPGWGVVWGVWFFALFETKRLVDSETQDRVGPSVAGISSPSTRISRDFFRSRVPLHPHVIETRNGRAIFTNSPISLCPTVHILSSCTLPHLHIWLSFHLTAINTTQHL